MGFWVTAEVIFGTLAFCALLSLAMYLLGRHGNSAQIISTLSLYAMAGL